MGTFANLKSSSTLSLDLEVRVAATDADLVDAGRVRETAYGHHLGATVVNFGMASDPLDRAPGTVVLLCRDKATGQAVGTARIQPSGSGAPLMIERSVILPHQLANQSRAEVTRLAVMPGASALVKLCLMKAVYLYCEAHGIHWLVIAARNEALSRDYRRLGFKDFLAPGQMVPLAHAGQLPHFVFTMDVQGIEDEWHRTGHRLHHFMFEAMHEDLPQFRPSSLPGSSSQRLVA
ncbi:MAG: hypothetical protein EPO09_02710 [Aquabacterium sp.]|uniref:N-acyl amino acid synthase FeeM domain-containing protein n=1 Tax=Aquabacterium sp. TaxID=1872578 RepID=UPI00121E45D0|nr:hypothetical protein [Aquabacterium sp.]TAK98137.1 MAG: hypothetical protein EPO09_02710 [Aquabacterium sp.]